VKQATVDVEDVRFYEHNGVDPQGIMRALIRNLTGGSLEGASTITQQLVRNTALSEEVETLRGQIDTLTREAADAKAAQEAIAKELEQANCNHADQDSLRQELDAAKHELADTKLQLEQARQAAATAQLNYELEAYRRAERAERMAGERVNRMYEQVNSILADAALQADENATLIGQAADRFVAQLSELQATIAQSSNTMKDTAAAICAVRPLKPE
jgi:predicted RNase H-like nuclease (RuvC/YqgF family)